MPQTFMATTYDLGDSSSPYGSVHQRHKKEVAERLAAAGLAAAYSKTTYTGPYVSKVSLVNAGSLGRAASHGATPRVLGNGAAGNRSRSPSARHGLSDHHTGPTITAVFGNVGARGLALTAMNTSTMFPQTNWSGNTPFEVCMAPARDLRPQADGALLLPPAKILCGGPGALAAGGDLWKENMTLRAAEAWCTSNSSCVGYTAQIGAGTSCSKAAVDTSVAEVYFKASNMGINIDTSWISYTKVVPCSVMSRFDGWVQPTTTTLETDGKTITLRGFFGDGPDARTKTRAADPAAGGPGGGETGGGGNADGGDDGGLVPVAVRFQWRAYPCEYLGCGLYSKVEMVPPPPFYAMLD